MNIRNIILSFILATPMSGWGQAVSTQKETPDTIADQELKEVTVVSRKAGVSRMAGAINGSVINKDELFKAAWLQPWRELHHKPFGRREL